MITVAQFLASTWLTFSLTFRIYSIIETCKANGLEPYTYLTYLFEKMPNLDFKIHPELLQQVMPWSEEVQNICK